MFNEEAMRQAGKTAPEFGLRLQKQQQILSLLRERGEVDWNIAAGDYAQRSMVIGLPILPEVLRDRDFDSDNLWGMERYFAGLINKMLSDNSSKPVVVLDLGGMGGVSWCKLARHFETDVSAGRVVFVVSNISYDPDQNKPTSTTNLINQKREFILDSKRLVHYIKADSAQLSKVTLHTSSGDICLRGNTDIVHESDSLTFHTQVPELEIPRIYDLLSERGVYLCAAGRPSNLLIHDGGKNLHYREMGVEIARKKLEERGLIRVDKIEEGETKGRELIYQVFRNRQAPPIQLES